MYLDFYKIKDEPFRLTPDPRFLQKSHYFALKVLLQGVAQRKGLMVLTGGIGLGKTTVVNALLTILAKAGASRFPTGLIVNPRLNYEELLEMLLTEFQVHCSSSSRAQKLLAFHTVLLGAQQNRGTVTVVVDEAHLLSSDVLEELRLLMNAESYRGKFLQVLLCGQPELEILLRRPELDAVRQRIALSAALRNFTLAETQNYIQERLRAVGLLDSPFSENSLRIIHSSTNGIPRLVNILCDSCMTIAAEQRCTEIGEDVVRASLALHRLAVHVRPNGKGPVHCAGELSGNASRPDLNSTEEQERVVGGRRS